MNIKIIMAFFVIAISGCKPFDINASGATKDATMDLKRYVDKDNGVVCYQDIDNTLSCVVVKGKGLSE